MIDININVLTGEFHLLPSGRRYALPALKGDLSYKMHFLMSSIHKDVSPVCQGTHAASDNKTLSLFLRTQISKNGGTTELIQICVRYDVILEMWACSETSLSETMRNVLEVIWSLFTSASIANTQS